MNRRFFLKAAGLFAVCAAPLASAFAAARGAFSQKEIAAAMKTLLGSERYTADAAVKFKAPEIAENGAVVPLTASYNAAATDIAFFVEQNPQPLAAHFVIGENGVPTVSTRIKMGESSLVHAVVKTADGALVGAVKEVKVTIGGCGG